MAELVQEPHDQIFSSGDRDKLHSLACHRCGSDRIHRSHPRNVLESLMRATTPLRFHRCSECGARGYHSTWSVHKAERPREFTRPEPTARCQSFPDTLAARIRRRRVLYSILIATVLGALASVVASTR